MTVRGFGFTIVAVGCDPAVGSATVAIANKQVTMNATLFSVLIRNRIVNAPGEAFNDSFRRNGGDASHCLRAVEVLG